MAVLDWDTNRYLESYFAVPRLGATLMKTNVRLSPEQVACTVDHSEAASLGRHPYLVFHVEREEHIDVWRVLHEQRDIPAWMNEA